jgi:hypothetical protein
VKRACGASQNWQWREARCSQYLEYWQAERQSQCRFWPQPLVGWRDFGPEQLSSSLPNAVTAVNLAGPEAKIVTAQRVFHYVAGSK